MQYLVVASYEDLVLGTIPDLMSKCLSRYGKPKHLLIARGTTLAAVNCSRVMGDCIDGIDRLVDGSHPILDDPDLPFEEITQVVNTYEPGALS